MPKIAIVGLSLFAALVLVLLFMFRQGELAQQSIRSNNEESGNNQTNRVGGEVDRDLLQQIKSQLSSIEARLQVLEQRPAVLPPGLPSVPAALPVVPPLQLPDGSDAPWAWIEKLDPVKKVSVEKAFEAAAASARSRMPSPGAVPDDSALEAAKEHMDQELAGRLRGILSPQEFEVYLLSLPDDALGRLGYEKSGN